MQTGDRVPDFTLPNQDGEPTSLSSLLANGPVVLFFYPAAMTKGCTIESCHFRDLKAEFDALGATRVGISLDTVDKQKKFADTYGFDYPLLADPDGAVAKIFGVKRAIGLLKVKRSTFVISQQFTVLSAFTSELKMEAHADEALATLRAQGTP
jgi:peroxiredoxin Q/BCP